MLYSLSTVGRIAVKPVITDGVSLGRLVVEAGHANGKLCSTSTPDDSV